MRILYVGIDIAKDTFDAAVCLAGTTEGLSIGQFENTTKGLGQLARKVNRLRKKQQAEAIQVIAEPTGGYELTLVTYAHEKAWRVSLPNPKSVRDWAGAIGMRAKTDKQDALLLARYGAQIQPKPQPPLPPEMLALESLLSRREDLKKLLRAEQNRLGNLQQRPQVPEAVMASVTHVIATLEEEMAEIQAAIDDLIDQNPDMKRRVKQLRTVPGIGPRNAPPIMLLLTRWDLLTGGEGTAKELTAYVGLDPRPYQSGRTLYKRAGISRMGSKILRGYLFLGARGGVRGDNVLHDFYQRLIGRGKAYKVAMVAAARKILVWAWSVFQHDTVFDPALAAPKMD